MVIKIEPEKVAKLGADEQIMLRNLLKVYHGSLYKNGKKDRYYEGKIPLSEVNLGIALPQGMSGLEIGCAWGAKTVDVLAARSMFDGFVGANGNDIADLDQIVLDNDFITEYAKGCRDELKLGCTFVTLSADPDISVKIRFHSPMTA
jgi:hypothetical protein